MLMTQSQLVCQICLKAPMMGNNRPKSLHKTRRVIKPNLQKMDGLVVCARCRRSLSRVGTR